MCWWLYISSLMISKCKYFTYKLPHHWPTGVVHRHPTHSKHTVTSYTISYKASYSIYISPLKNVVKWWKETWDNSLDLFRSCKVKLFVPHIDKYPKPSCHYDVHREILSNARYFSNVILHSLSAHVDYVISFTAHPSSPASQELSSILPPSFPSFLTTHLRLTLCFTLFHFSVNVVTY